VAIAGRTLLQTGLFIVAHDAMHGTLWPERPTANRRIGQLALLLYAAIPYEPCRANHVLHHRHAGTAADPDHHGGGEGSFFRWFGRFMAAYLSVGQLTVLVLSWLALAALAAPFTASPLSNVLIYGALPALLSAVQLFLVGTFLPHRHWGAASTGADGSPGDGASHQPRSLDLPVWLSLLSCYHFGYHWEHHAFPHLAWHELPAARRRIKLGCGSAAGFALDLSGR
jgi:beta-carotene ketolase (CrtW type)